jgi:methyl-accepting chemotaxis protein
LADSDTEKVLKRLVGRKEVEEAVLRLDTLTKEENVMIVARNLEITHRVDGNVEASKVLTENIDNNVKATISLTEDIDGNVKATKALTEDIGDNVNAIKALTEDVSDNVKVTKTLAEDIGDDVKATRDGTRGFPSIFIHALIIMPPTVTDNVQRLSL